MKNKFLSVAASTAIVASALVFSGCGDSDSSSSTSSTSSTGGTASLTGTFVKGMWDNVPYRTNSSISGKTTDGVYSFNAGDWVEFDLGLIKANVTAPTNNSVAALTDASGIALKNAVTNGTVSATDLDNFIKAVLVVGGNQTTLESNGGKDFDATNLIARLTTLAGAGVDISKASFVADMDAQMTAKNISVATGSKNIYSITTADVTNLKNAVIATAVEAKATAAGTNALTSGTLNSTRLNNTAIVFTDGSSINLSFGPGSQNGTNVTGFGTSTPTAWNASGSTLVMGVNGNMTNYSADRVIFAGSPVSGVAATLINGGNGTTVTKTVSAVYGNLWKLASGGHTFNMTTTQFALNISGNSTANDTLAANMTLADGTVYGSLGNNASKLDGAYNQTLMLQLVKDNAGSNKNGTNLTFDHDPTTAGNTATGVLANITVTINSVISSLVGLGKVILSFLKIA